MALVVVLTALLLGGIGFLLVGLLGGKTAAPPAGELRAVRLTDGEPVVGFVPQAMNELDGSFALLLINPKTNEWEVRIFAINGEFKGGMAAYAKNRLPK